MFDATFNGNLSYLNGTLFSEIYSRYLELYRKTPTERYLDLIAQYPDILDIISLRDIASYLLVTPVYLSRIRKISLKSQANKTCFILKSFFLPNFAKKN